MKTQRGMDQQLLTAASYGTFEDVRECLIEGADVNTDEDLSPLHRALRSGNHVEFNIETAELLIMWGADVNSTNDALFRSPLLLNNQADAIELLLRHRADINAQHRNGWTALHMAAICNDQDAVALLFKHKIDPTLRDMKGRTAEELPIGLEIQALINKETKEQQAAEEQQTAKEQQAVKISEPK